MDFYCKGSGPTPLKCRNNVAWTLTFNFSSVAANNSNYPSYCKLSPSAHFRVGLLHTRWCHLFLGGQNIPRLNAIGLHIPYMVQTLYANMPLKTNTPYALIHSSWHPHNSVAISLQAKTLKVDWVNKVKVNILCSSSEMKFIISLEDTTAVAPEPDFWVFTRLFFPMVLVGQLSWRDKALSRLAFHSRTRHH